MDWVRVNRDAQHDPAWLQWSRPDRIATQVDRLFRRVMTTPVEAVPMPTTGRHSYTMLAWMDTFFGWYFPQRCDLADPDKAEVLDEFVCWVGQTFERRAAAIWANDVDGPRIGASGYSPAVVYRLSPDMLPDNIVELVTDPHPDILEEADPGFPTLWAVDRILRARVDSCDYERFRRE